MTTPRWRSTCAASRHVEALIREGAINETSIGDESFMSKLHQDNDETKKFLFERFMKSARESLKRIKEMAGAIGKYTYLLALYTDAVSPFLCF